MVKSAVGQLELGLFTDPAPRGGGVVVTRAMRVHRRRGHVLERVHYVRRFFPELGDDTLRVGVTRAASGMAVPGGNEIWLNPNQPSYHTIAHEMVHLLQKRDLGIPQGERSCDVFSLARHWTLNDVNPSYVKIPTSLLTPDGSIRPEAARLVHDVATDAVARRKAGLRNYISYFESRVRELADSGSAQSEGKA